MFPFLTRAIRRGFLAASLGMAVGEANAQATYGISTLAGELNSPGAVDGTGATARFRDPAAVVVDSAGNLYIADASNHAVRKVAVSTGLVTTVAGQLGTSGTVDGAGPEARFNLPQGLALDAAANKLYVADTFNHTIRVIDLAPATSVVSTLAGGAGTPGSTNGTGTAARFHFPYGLALSGGNLYVADTNNQSIRRIVVATGTVTTLAGPDGSLGNTPGTQGFVDSATPASARFLNPIGLAADNVNLYAADRDNNRIRRVVLATGEVSTLAGAATAGSVDGAGATATFNGPDGLAIDSNGSGTGTTLLVTDALNHTLRRVELATAAVTTLAGTAGSGGFADGLGTAARFTRPTGIALDSASHFYVADRGNQLIRRGSVATAPAITSANSATFALGSSGSFTFTATGSPAPTFSVLAGTLPLGVTLSPAGVLSGVPVTSVGSQFPFTVQASNGVAPAATQAFTLTVSQPPVITSAATTAFVVGVPATFQVVATGLPAPTFSITAGILPAPVAVMNASGLITAAPPATASGSPFTFTITATNSAGSASQVFTLNVGSGPTISTQPRAAAVVAGVGAQFSVVAEANFGGPLTYQWQRQAAGTVGFVPLTEGGKYSGTTTATLTVSPTALADSGDLFQVLVGGTALSLPAELRVDVPPQITTPPQALALVAGQTATFTVAASGTGLQYQWRRNGMPLAGATDPTLNLGAASRVQADLYDVVVSSGVATTVSAPARLTVAPTAAGQTLLPDPAFAPAFESSGGTVRGMLQLSNGRMLVFGGFTSIGGIPARNIARLNADGSVDPTFVVPPIDSSVSAVAAQADGRLVIAGAFTRIGDQARRGVARLNSDGSLDSAFVPTSSSFTNAVVIQADGRIVVGTSTAAGSSGLGYLARLHPDGAPDASFAPSLNGSVRALALQADGKLVVGGTFTTLEGNSMNRIARLLPSGQVDSSFEVGSGFGGEVHALSLLPDGRLLVGGSFTTYRDLAAPRVLRLLASGAVDPTWQPGNAGGPPGTILALLPQADGSIWVGGGFLTFDGLPRSNLARLLPSGALDAGFAPPVQPNSIVYALQLAADGSVWLSGAFSSVGTQDAFGVARMGADGVALPSPSAPGLRSPGFVQRAIPLPGGRILAVGSFSHVNGEAKPHMVRLMATGALDPTFNPGGLGPSAAVQDAVVQADGKILLTGSFDRYNGVPRARLARLTADGELDPNFEPGTGPNTTPTRIYALAGGRVLLVGNLSSFSGLARSVIIRINADGSPDATFDAGYLNGTVQTAVQQSDGRLVIGGTFTTVAGQARERLARLEVSGALEPTFLANADGTVSAVALQPDGRLLVGGSFGAINGVARTRVARLLAHGAVDPDWDDSVGPNGSVSQVIPLETGGLVLRGSFTTISGRPLRAVARLSAQGSLDATLGLAELGSANPSGLSILDDGAFLLAGGVMMVRDVDRLGLVRTVSSAVPRVTVTPAGSVSLQAGSALTLSVQVAGGGDVSFRWHRNGTPIPGARAASYALTQAAEADAGAYTVAVTHAGGVSFSAPVQVSVSPAAPSLGSRRIISFGGSPAVLSGNQTATGDSSAATTAKVGSIRALVAPTPLAASRPLTYQWFKDGVPLPGATSPAYTPFPWQLGDAGAYTVRLSNALGAVTSPALVQTVSASADWVPWFPLPQNNALNEVLFADGRFVAAGAQGTLLTSTDGRTWTVQRLGASESVGRLSYGNGTYVAHFSYGSIFTSTDAVTWTRRRAPVGLDGQSTAMTPHALIFAAGRFVAVGENGLVATSPDGANWTVAASGTTDSIRGVAYGAGRFVAVTGVGGTLASTDGLTWSPGPASPEVFFALAFGEGVFVAGTGNAVYASSYGERWTRRPLPTTGSLLDVRHTSAGFVGISSRIAPGEYLYSADGLTWVRRAMDLNLTAAPASIVYGAGQWVAVGRAPETLLMSGNGLNWTRTGPLTSFNLRAVATRGTTAVAVGTAGTIYAATDPLNWVPRTSGTISTLNDVAASPAGFVAVGDGATVRHSPDGVTWTPVSSGTANSLRGVSVVNGRFLATGDFGTLSESADGLTWTPVATGLGQALYKVAGGVGRMVVVGSGGLFATSSDGAVWTALPAVGASTWVDVVYERGIFVAVASDGRIRTSADGVSWTERTNPTGLGLAAVASVAGRFHALPTAWNTYLSSEDGITWTAAQNGVGNVLNDITAFGGSALAVGQAGTVVATSVPVAPPVPVPPVIATQPANATVIAGQPGMLSVAVAGGGLGLNYQWRRNGVNLPGATRAELSFPAVSWTDADTYDVVVSDGPYSTVSSPARLSVPPAAYPGLLALDPAWDLRLEQPVTPTLYSTLAAGAGQYYVTGLFTSINGHRSPMIARVSEAGVVDPTFAAREVDGAVRTAVVQADGKLVIGGDFSRVGGVLAPRIARLNADGTLDPTFRVGTETNGSVLALVQQPDGRLLVGGNFTRVTTSSRGYLVRLHADGTLDESFGGSGAGLNGSVTAILLAADGSLYAGGSFTTFNGQPFSRLVKLTASGALAPGFSVGASGFSSTVNALAATADGRLLVGGAFTTFNGVTASRIVRLLATGELDPTFTPGSGAGSTVNTLLSLADGRVLVGGAFTSFNGDLAHAHLARLSAAGLPDGVVSGASGTINHLRMNASGLPVAVGPAVLRLGADGLGVTTEPLTWRGSGSAAALVAQPGGKVVVAGSFSVARGVTAPSIVRVNRDGSLDPTFNPGGLGPDARITAARALAGGGLAIAGAFTTYNGATRGGVAVLRADGTLDPAFVPDPTVAGSATALAVLPGDRLAVAGTLGGPENRLRFFLPDGRMDPTAYQEVTTNQPVVTLAAAGSDRVLFGGNMTFTSPNTGFPNAVTTRGLGAVLVASGLDPTFNARQSGASSSVNAIATLSDGKFLIGGAFTSYNGTSRAGLARVLTTGGLDSGYSPSSSTTLHGMLVQEDGRVLMRGTFGSSGGSTRAAFLARLAANGATDATFVLPGVRSAAAGGGAMLMLDSGQLVLADSFQGVVGTRSATLPVITTPPQSQVAAVGGSATFAVAASSLDPLRFQWLFNGNPIPGATGATLVRSNLQATQAGLYSVVVTSDVGSTLSAAATLGGAAPVPTITVQPSDVTVGTGQPAMFTVTANGVGPLTYQWRRNGVPIAGATGRALEFAPATRLDADRYDVLVAHGLSVASSNPAQLRVAPAAYPGSVVPDPAFNLGLEAVGGSVYAVAPQPDGRTYVAGNFATAGTHRSPMLLRLLADTTVDPTFRAAEMDADVRAVAVQPDGKVLVGGSFTRVGGVPVGRLARLHPDGTLDPSFNPGTGLNGLVYTLLLQADGKLWVGGSFSAVNGRAVASLVRFHPDGTPDATFNPGGAGPSGTVFALLALPDQRVLVGGGFATYNGQSGTLRVARLLADGAVDSSFTSAGPNSSVRALAVQPDGAYLIGGDFTAYGTTPMGRLARLLPGGELDFSFGVGAAGFNSTVHAILARADGSVLVGGAHTRYDATGTSYLTLLTAQGSFSRGLSPNTIVYSLAAQSDGRIWVGGNFATINSATRPRVARLSSTLSNDAGPTFELRVDSAASMILPLPEGKVLLGGNFSILRGAAVTPPLVCLTAAGAVDPTFNAGGAGPNGSIAGAVRLPDGRIAIVGGFTTYNGLARSSLAVLAADGTLDRSFEPPAAGVGSSVYTVAALPGGKVLVAGSFTSAGGESRSRIAVFRTDGALDPGFNPAVGGTIYSVLVLPDGRILIGGDFTSVNGVVQNRIACLRPDGSLDPTFNAGTGFSGIVFGFALQPDGKIVVAGSFATVQGVAQRLVARLLPGGALDPSFVPQPAFASGTVTGLLLQEDGKVVLHGSHATVADDPGSVVLTRLLPDGTRDEGFMAAGFAYGAGQTPGWGLTQLDTGRLLMPGRYGIEATLPGRQAQSIRFAPLATRFVSDPPVALSATATSGLPVTFSLLSGPAVVSGSTVTVTGAGVVSLRASQAGNEIYAPAPNVSQSFTVSAADPLITTGPAAQLAAPGAAVTLGVTAAGSGTLSYQWSLNGEAIPGATNATHVIPALSRATAGRYQVAVANATGVASSFPALVRLTGNLWATGADGAGQLGLGAPLAWAAAPVARAVNVAAGDSHTLFLQGDGSLWAMGLNGRGQLGDGTTTHRPSPVRIAEQVSAVAAGDSHSIFLKRDGTVWTMGINDTGQLGDGTRTDRSSPVQIAAGVRAISAGNNRIAFLRQDGTLWTAGRNLEGQLGDGTTTERATPVLVAAGVSEVAAGGYYHTLFRKTDGTVWAMGLNTSGQLGDGSTTNRSSPVQIATNAAAIAAGGYHSLVLKTDGSLWATGSNSSGQLGDGTLLGRTSPVAVATGVTAVAAGFDHSLFLKADGSLWGMGANGSGQLADGTVLNRSLPVPVAAGVVAMAAGSGGSAYLRLDGSLWTAGRNDFGQLGNGAAAQRSTPAFVAANVGEVSAGDRHTFFLQGDGTLRAMGNNSYGQLGDGTTIARNTPVVVATGVSTATAAGYHHSLFLKTDGTLWATGSNANGQLGDGTVTSRSSPVQVATGVAALGAGDHFSLFVKQDGTLWAMGYNASGQLGDGTTSTRLSPVAVATGVIAVVAGDNHSAFLKGDGTLWTMGLNDTGQLGDGTTTNRTLPVQVASGVASISAGNNRVVFVKTDGTLWTMGYNLYGQLGDGTFVNRSSPVQIATGVIAATATGRYYTRFLKADGSVWVTGRNREGQLGDGTYADTAIPLQVAADASGIGAGFTSGFFIQNPSVGTPPAFSTQPADTAAAAGTAVTLSALATGTGPIDYRWRRNGVDLPAARSPQLVLPYLRPEDAGAYTVVATNAAGSATSTSAAVTVQAATLAVAVTSPVVNEASPWAVFTVTGSPGQPVAVALVAGTATGGGTDFGAADPAAALHYSTDDGVTWLNGGAGSFALPAVGQALVRTPVVNDSTPESSETFLLQVTPAGGTPVAGTATIRDDGVGTIFQPDGTVNLAAAKDDDRLVPVITSASTASAAVGSAFSYQITATRGPTSFLASGLPAGLTLQPASGLITGTPATTGVSSVLLSAANAAGTGPAALLTLTVTTRTAPLFTLQPVSQSLAAPGGTVTFSVAANGTPAPGFQWYFNGGLIPGATSATLTLANVQAAAAGNYWVVATNAGGSERSSTASFSLTQPGNSATQALLGTGYVAGQTLRVTNTLHYTGTASALSWSVLLPAGWSFASATGSAGEQGPAVGTTDLLEWAWTAIPPSPVTFTYAVQVPAGTTGPRELVALGGVRNGLSLQFLAQPDPLVVNPVRPHSADTNADYRLSLLELTRVIELYNTRNGPTRTGAYAPSVAPTEDGFAPDAARPANAAATLTRHHSADTNRDGRLSLFELTRVIELYNTRSGGTRTGQYRPQEGTEDGFDPAP